jgi:hypothetical protein
MQAYWCSRHPPYPDMTRKLVMIQQRQNGLTCVLLLVVILLEIVDGFQGAAVDDRMQQYHHWSHSTFLLASTPTIPLHSKRQNDIDNEDFVGTESDMNPFTKSVWYGVEKFGQVFATLNNNNKSQETSKDKVNFSSPPSSLDETLQRIQLDNDRSYFLSGQVDKKIYDKDCLFADPFVSFRGRDRFVDNLQNLGSFITNYNAKIIKYNVGSMVIDTQSNNPITIETKIMVKLELNLPWKPVLAWPWGVTYEVDPISYLITKHEESWDIEPWEGIKQIFRKATVKI